MDLALGSALAGAGEALSGRRARSKKKGDFIVEPGVEGEQINAEDTP